MLNRTNEWGYVSGPYGDRRIRSSSMRLDWINEWDLIPKGQKKELLIWLENIQIDHILYDQSLTAQSGNPIVEHLVKEKVLPEICDIVLVETPDMESKNIHDHDTAKPFMQAFMKHKKIGSKMMPIFQPNKTRLGFIVNDYEEIHFIHFATLHPVWCPQSQTALAKVATDKMKSSSEKNDVHLDEMFRTTNKHLLGEFRAGILSLNIAELSTIMNGIQHAIKLPLPRYKIEWVNLKNPRDRVQISYESSEISVMIENNEIEETDGFEKAPKIYPETRQVEYGESKVRIGKKKLEESAC